MAQRLQAESASQAQPGAILVVIHDFVARSSDELTLAKGDRVELIERDDDFGDGWYLGRHLQNGNTGLFPEVYTKTAPKGTLMAGQGVRQNGSPGSNPALAAAQRAPVVAGAGVHNRQVSPQPPQPPQSAPPASNDPFGHPPQARYENAQPSPTVPTMTISAAPTTLRSSPMSQLNNAQSGRASNTSSTVMDQTLSVIDEHITDMRKPGRSASPRARRMTSDSASDYSAMAPPSEHRLSYIPGSESEEEESDRLTAREVKKWSPERVAEYLTSVGVEKGHCDVFREQEFSGEVVLGMDQSSIFLKELELGPIGRRLKTWQKIRALQDEVSPPPPSQTRKVSESTKGDGRRGSSTNLHQRAGHTHERSLTDQSESAFPQMQPSPQPAQGGALSTLSRISASVGHSTRPSAASIRSLGHSRRQSSIDQTVNTSVQNTPQSAQAGHHKQPSFDRNWNMSNVSGQANGSARPVSSHHGYSLSSDRPQFEKRGSQLSLNTMSVDADRGYVSGSEADSHRPSRRVLRKRDADHSRQSSYETGKRLSFFRRSSRASSMTRTPDISAPGSVRHFATGSKPSDEIDGRSEAPSDISGAPPMVTNLEQTESPRTRENKEDLPTKSPRMGLRAISDAVTGREKAQHAWADNKSPTSDISTPHSPSSGTPSAASKSFDLEDANSGKYSTPLNQGPGPRRKTKKETSAYTRGLEKRTPQEAIIGSDYSGWMKKKSSTFVTTWKPRLFVLKGKRLSYYYSDKDTQERGLIDISGHRVLPADKERFTGFHASLSKATSSPTSPQILNAATFSSNSSTSPVKDTENDSTADTSVSVTDTSSIPNTPQDMTPDGQGFIFKLVPPRAGMSRAVNFTKPTVHYFAVPSVEVGRLWMAALMKATIDRDENTQVVTTYQQKTISLEKARARKERPPALQEADMQTVGGASEADSTLEKVDEAMDAEEQEERADQVKMEEEEPIGQMREVTDLSPLVDRNSISPQHSKKGSRGGRKSGSGDGSGLGIHGLGNNKQAQKSGLWGS